MSTYIFNVSYLIPQQSQFLGSRPCLKRSLRLSIEGSPGINFFPAFVERLAISASHLAPLFLSVAGTSRSRPSLRRPHRRHRPLSMRGRRRRVHPQVGRVGRPSPATRALDPGQRPPVGSRPPTATGLRMPPPIGPDFARQQQMSKLVPGACRPDRMLDLRREPACRRHERFVAVAGVAERHSPVAGDSARCSGLGHNSPNGPHGLRTRSAAELHGRNRPPGHDRAPNLPAWDRTRRPH